MNFFDIIPLIQTVGLIGIFFLVFAESGLFFGFFLPGDSLLFTAGILAGTGNFNIFLLFFGCFFMAILGDSFGYYFGKRVGPKIFSKPNSFFWNKKNIVRTSIFFEHHGNKAITLARFVPIVRTFTPIMAGVGNMKYKSFLFWNILGAFAWTTVMIFAGYFLGNTVKNIDKYILPMIFIIIMISLIPILIEILKKPKKEIKKSIDNSDKDLDIV